MTVCLDYSLAEPVRTRLCDAFYSYSKKPVSPGIELSLIGFYRVIVQLSRESYSS